ncbi:MAG TPA: hypothetical protein ENH13_06230 [Euryarchaeota archaeon]|nr:hypothetical protein BMS3Abin16_01387 [archaeon BMS3Abin16]HDH28056.1 hypothetical protein [Euryarchaeota archaeon]HDH28712.1 hypothetical protein [Euryarchaeota archaeon]
MAVELTLLINGLLIFLSIYFGVQALLMFKKMGLGDIFKRLAEQEKHKLRLLYASVFLGSTLIAFSIFQGARYLVGIAASCTGLISISCSDLLFFAVNLSLLAITYAWYGFLRDASRV